MSLEKNEVVILDIRPHAYQMLMYIMMIMPILALLLILLSSENGVSVALWFPLIMSTIAVISFAFTRFTLTSERMILSFASIYTTEIYKNQVDDIRITPNDVYVLNSSSSKALMFKNILGEKFEQTDPRYWYKKGVLRVKHQHRFKAFRKASLDLIALQIFSAEQIDDILFHLEQDWGINAKRVELQPDDLADLPDIATNDIGKSVLYFVAIGLVMLITGMFFPAKFFQGLHFGVESYIWMLPLIVLAGIISYFFIKRENKSYPLFSTLFIALFLGASSYFLALQINRSYSEKNPKTIPISMTLTSIDEDSQIWTLPDYFANRTGLNEIYIHKNWEGYSTHLEQGKSYNVKVKKGLFNDYFVDKDSFQQLDTTP